MERVAEPLRQMGAQIETTDGHLPLTITGATLQAIDYELPVASAQVKSAVLLAGLGARRARRPSIEPAPTRDHTELMLRAAGARVTTRPQLGRASSRRDELRRSAGRRARATSRRRRRSSSPRRSLPESRITIHDVNLNPRRTGLLDVLERMGARVGDLQPRARVGGEQVGDLEVRARRARRDDDRARRGAAARRRAAALRRCSPRARAATSWVYGAEELRAKETDRIEAVVDALRAIGVRARGARRTASRSPASRRGRAAARSTRAATTGSRCSARSPALVSREGVEIEGAESVGDKLPRLLSTSSTST